MNLITSFGATADVDELREVAVLADAGPSPELAARLAALPRCVLTRKTLASPPKVIADRLRGVIVFLERRQRGVRFGAPGFAGEVARLRDEQQRGG